MFGRDLAKVGVGTPVTRDLKYYHDDSFGLWDSEGFELGDDPSEEVRSSLQEISERPHDEQVSVVWYCISSRADRLGKKEIEAIQAISDSGLPVILVLTKVRWVKIPLKGKNTIPDDMKPFWNWLHEPFDGDTGEPIDLAVRAIIPTSAVGNKGKGKGYGLSELVATTLLESPDDEKDAFRIAQRLNLPWKREMARTVIGASTVAAGVAAAVPIPIASASVLAPIQLAMMGRIAAIYELDMKTMMSTSTLAQLATQFAGRAMARSLLNLIPGVGSVINSAVASALTGAGGEAWMRFCEQVHQGKVSLDNIDEMMQGFAPGFLDLVTNLLKETVPSKRKRQ